MWKDIAFIVFSAVTVNHLGLVGAIERITGKKLWVVDCPKCLSCWLVAAHLLLTGTPLLKTCFLALLSAYAAIWLELLEGVTDRLYDVIYGKVFSAAHTADDDQAGASGRLPVM